MSGRFPDVYFEGARFERYVEGIGVRLLKAAPCRKMSLRICSSVRPSARPSVGPSVRPSVHLSTCLSV